MLILLFYIAIALTLYTYLIFPFILLIMTKFRKEKTDNCSLLKINERHFSVAIVCAMYNEEKVVRKKIENFLSLKYDNIKLYIGSDGSSDQTNNILNKYSHYKNILVFNFPRRGKVHVLNDLIKSVNEEIIVFTDANTMFEADSIAKLLLHFLSPKIGVVSGKLKLIHSGQVTGEGFYWKYETAIKKMENTLNCLIGANGAIYAVRRELLSPLPDNTINDDFTISMRILEQGYGVKFEEEAVAYEEDNHDDKIEFKRHIRDGAGHYRALIHLYKLLNPFRFKVFFLYISHRVIRWMVPIFLLLLLFCPLFMELKGVTKLFVFFEILFYSFVVVGWLTRTRNKIFYIPYYFIYINAALLIGLIKNIMGIQKVTWNSTVR